MTGLEMKRKIEDGDSALPEPKSGGVLWQRLVAVSLRMTAVSVPHFEPSDLLAGFSASPNTKAATRH